MILLHKSLCKHDFELRQVKFKLMEMTEFQTKQVATEDSKFLPEVNKLKKIPSQILTIIAHDNVFSKFPSVLMHIAGHYNQ